jgi:hypothetical protein
MNITDFRQSLTAAAPPAGSSIYLQSLWYDAKGNWEQAHTLIQDLTDKKAAWIHAYLHRCEGDVWNANYWYNKADQRMPGYSLEQEWKELVQLASSEW